MTRVLRCDNCGNVEEEFHQNQPTLGRGIKGTISDPCNPDDTENFDLCCACTELVFKGLPKLVEKLSQTDLASEYGF